MSLPFTRDEFFALFVAYNQVVWPLPVILPVVMGSGAVAALWRNAGWRVLVAATGAVWLWTAVAYHLQFFVTMSPAGYVFGAAFALEALLLMWYAAGKTLAAPMPHDATSRLTGMALIVYAIAGYPLVGFLAGQRFPAMPTFGLPCPTTLFTFGVLALTGARLPARLLIVPGAWAFIATTAALSFEITEDLALVPALVAVMALRWRAGRRTPRAVVA